MEDFYPLTSKELTALTRALKQIPKMPSVSDQALKIMQSTLKAFAKADTGISAATTQIAAVAVKALAQSFEPQMSATSSMVAMLKDVESTYKGISPSDLTLAAELSRRIDPPLPRTVAEYVISEHEMFSSDFSKVAEYLSASEEQDDEGVILPTPLERHEVRPNTDSSEQTIASAVAQDSSVVHDRIQSIAAIIGLLLTAWQLYLSLNQAPAVVINNNSYTINIESDYSAAFEEFSSEFLAALDATESLPLPSESVQPSTPQEAPMQIPTAEDNTPPSEPVPSAGQLKRTIVHE